MKIIVILLLVILSVGFLVLILFADYLDCQVELPSVRASPLALPAFLHAVLCSGSGSVQFLEFAATRQEAHCSGARGTRGCPLLADKGPALRKSLSLILTL